MKPHCARWRASFAPAKSCIKLFLPYPLHAKLYLLFRDDVNNPITGFVGSSNLTMQGLARQGELNVDVLDHDATQRAVEVVRRPLGRPLGLDVSAELAEIIEASWAREAGDSAVPHLPQDRLPPEHRGARRLEPVPACPRGFEQDLFEFQKARSRSPRAT